mmetsp:Transcript_10967/g.21446  ORF Transcript_10967/g.21446 Transcript_10967/m.21446 type:complete len:250 (+) Transcript_10967:3371-4120(+)
MQHNKRRGLYPRCCCANVQTRFELVTVALLVHNEGLKVCTTLYAHILAWAWCLLSIFSWKLRFNLHDKFSRFMSFPRFAQVNSTSRSSVHARFFLRNADTVRRFEMQTTRTTSEKVKGLGYLDQATTLCMNFCAGHRDCSSFECPFDHARSVLDTLGSETRKDQSDATSSIWGRHRGAVHESLLTQGPFRHSSDCGSRSCDCNTYTTVVARSTRRPCITLGRRAFAGLHAVICKHHGFFYVGSNADERI